jgi:hypothetical protein
VRHEVAGANGQPVSLWKSVDFEFEFGATIVHVRMRG